MDRIAFVTRSINDRLFDLSGELVDSRFERIRLTGTDADNYFYAFNEIDADWIINFDEDAFIIDCDRVFSLLQFMKENGYDCCGVPDGGVLSHRFHNPCSPNPFFSIHNNKKIKERFNLEEIENTVFQDDLRCFAPTELLKSNRKFEFDNFEPYYKYFFWLLRSGFKFLYLDALDWERDPIATVLMDQLRQPMLVHCWYARDYENQQWRFHQAYEFAKAWQEKKQREKDGVVTMEMTPCSTVIGIDGRRSGPLLRQTLESALAQNIPGSLKVILLGDDAPKDELLSGLDRERLVELGCENSLDQASARNRMLEHIDSNFVLWLDDNSFLEKDAFRNFFSCLERNPDADIIYGNELICDENNAIKQQLVYRQESPSAILNGLFFQCIFPKRGVLIRKTLFDTVGGYNPTLWDELDYDFWVRAALKESAFVHCGSVVLRNLENLSSGSDDSDQFGSNSRAAILEQLVRDLPLRRIFPMFNWEHEPQKSGANALALVSLMFAKYRCYDKALRVALQSENVFRNKEAIAIRGLIHRARGEYEQAASALAYAVALENQELAKLLRLGQLI